MTADGVPQGASDGGGERPVTLAAVAGAHGVRGAVRLKLFTDVEGLRAHRVFQAGGAALTLRSVTDAGVAVFDEVRDRNAAEALRGAALTVPREALPPLGEGEYYWHDLVGLAVVDAEGAALGVVAGVENFGAGDLLDVERADGRRFLAPVRGADVGARVVIDAAWAEA